MSLWESEQLEVDTATEEKVAVWKRDIIRLLHTEEWLSMRKLLMYREKKLLDKLYTQRLSGLESDALRRIGKAGAYREILNLPQQIEEESL